MNFQQHNEESFILQEEMNEKYESLEERISNLENQNSHLLYFIYFLYENFPELVRKILPQNTFIQLMLRNNKISNPEKTSNPHQSNPSFSVTAREKEILNLLASGLCAKEIAQKLFISEATVITHKKNLKEKFEARNTVELINKAHNFLKENSNDLI